MTNLEINIDDLNVDNVEEFLTQKQKERVDSILLIINSDRSNEEKKRLLKRRNKKDLKKVVNFLENIRKTFIISSLKTGERRVFSLEEFESKNKDYIDKNNLIRIYLGEYPRLSSIDRKAFWFEALLQCLVLGHLPLYWGDSGNKVNIDFYTSYKVKELNQILTRDIEKPLDIWDDKEYAKQRSVSFPNLKRYYNLENPNTPWPKNNFSFREIQENLNIPIPLEKDPEGIDKDIIIYYMVLTGNRDSEMNQIKSSIIYDRLGFVRSPQTIQELFTMNTQTFNINRNFVRRELTRRWKEIPTIYGEFDEKFSLGISRKIKYCYIANNMRDKHPKNLTYTSNMIDLLPVLKIIERDYE